MGTVAAGSVRVGEEIAISGGQTTRVRRIIAAQGETETAEAGEAVALQLSEERDIGRGSAFSAARDAVQVADQLQAHLIWCDDAPLWCRVAPTWSSSAPRWYPAA
jgi:sulfate adenylyltransferase subunit 1 (EFTu-like GTPase family)